MNARLTIRTAHRVLTQLRRDTRTIAMVIVVPMVLLTLLWWMLKDSAYPNGQPLFDPFGARLMGLFPLIMMFLITSVSTLRERTTGTMERLMTSPAAKSDIVLGYAFALSFMATVQAVVLVSYAIWGLGLTISSGTWELVLIIVLDAILGTALGLAASSIARTEFQAVQLMPLVIMPQLFITGLFMPRDQMPQILKWISDALPLSYSIDAINDILSDNPDSVWSEVGVLIAFIVGAILLGIVTLRRRTP